MELRMESLTVGYGGDPVIKDVDLVFDKPQLVSILGPNGVGKSTLVQCIDNLLKPVSGKVLLDKKPVEEYEPRELAKRIGYVPCASYTSFPMTVADTVLIGRYPRNGRKRTDRDLRIVHSSLKLLGIEDLALRSFNELSAGQHQKVVLARGLAQETDVLILDEPTSNLDIKHQISVSRILKMLSERREMLIIMISHDLNIASRFSDRIILLHDGGVFADGSPSEVLTSENINAVYGIRSKVLEQNGRPYIVIDADEDGSISVDDIDGLFPPEERWRLEDWRQGCDWRRAT